jgi:hypothetical protein
VQQARRECGGRWVSGLGWQAGAACTASSGPGPKGGARYCRHRALRGKQRSASWRESAIACARGGFGWGVRARGRAVGAPDADHAGVGSPSDGLYPAASGFGARVRAAGWGPRGSRCGLTAADSCLRAVPPRLTAMHLRMGATGSARDFIRHFHTYMLSREAIRSTGCAFFAALAANYPEGMPVV